MFYLKQTFVRLLICVFVSFWGFLELGEGPFTLSNTEQNESVCVFGANVSSGEVFPLLKTSAQPSTIFHFMITTGLYKDRASREYMHMHQNPVHKMKKNLTKKSNTNICR